MSDNRRQPWEERRDQKRAYDREQEVRVTCKHLIFRHLTNRGGVKLQEGEELAGANWRTDGRTVWVPMQACTFEPPLERLDEWDEVTVTMPKKMADEKEMLYE